MISNAENSFKIGDQILWIDSSNLEFHGTVIEKGHNLYHWTCKMDNNFIAKYNMEQYEWYYPRIKNMSLNKTKEERVCEKSRRLWNKSAFVLRNPHLAY